MTVGQKPLAPEVLEVEYKKVSTGEVFSARYAYTSTDGECFYAVTDKDNNTYAVTEKELFSRFKTGEYKKIPEGGRNVIK